MLGSIVGDSMTGRKTALCTFQIREELLLDDNRSPKLPGSVRDLNRERFQEEVARELGVDISPADHVPTRESQVEGPVKDESAQSSDAPE